MPMGLEAELVEADDNPFENPSEEYAPVEAVRQVAHEWRQEKGIVNPEYQNIPFEELESRAIKEAEEKGTEAGIQLWVKVYSGEHPTTAGTLGSFIEKNLGKNGANEASIVSEYLMGAGMGPDFWDAIGVDPNDFKVENPERLAEAVRLYN